jgi:LmbE family N-acetylglucosaminyl deacetylase
MSLPAELLGRVLVLVAHPDDETIGCGALLQRMAEPVVVFATDGAPRDPFFWKKYGSRSQYARLRQQEAKTSLARAGVNRVVFLAGSDARDDWFVDQELFRAVPRAVAAMEELVERFRPVALLTMAYEGGHPDHDTCSFIGSVLRARHRIPVWEYPLYFRQKTAKPIFQNFVDSDGDQVFELEVSAEEGARKREMLADYASQNLFLLNFDAKRERFRPQPDYDYSQPPHAGVLNYEAWQWPMKGSDVCAAFTAFLASERRQVV